MTILIIFVLAVVLVCIASPPAKWDLLDARGIKILVAGFLGAVVVVGAPRLLANYQWASARHVVDKWLEAQRRGQAGDEFWLDESQAVRLFAVRDWEITNEREDTVTVRVSSSNAAGIPIMVLLNVGVTKEGKICLVEEAVPSVDPELERARDRLLQIEQELKAGMK